MISMILGALLALGSLPAVYAGQWTDDLKSCGGEDVHGLTIQPGRITFYEADGVVRSASEGSKGASAKVDFTGEGRSWSEAVRLRPLPGNRLEITALGRTQVFLRCPA